MGVTKTQAAPVRTQAKTVDTPAKAAATPAKAAPKSSSFAAVKQKPLSMTGKYKAAKPPDTASAALKADLAKARAAAAAGTTVKATPLSPEVTSALRMLKLSVNPGDVVNNVGDQMAKLSPKHQKELYLNLPKNVKAQVDFEINGGKAASPGLSLARVGTMTHEKLAETAALVRGGVIEDIGLQVAVATELAARTKWGKENPDIVEHQKQMLTDGKINFKDGRGAARTDSDGSIELDFSVAKSPEGMAALLAHEATHSYNAANGGMSKSVYEEETSGNMASARVFAEIGDANDSNLSKDALDGLNDYAQNYKTKGEDGVQARLAAEYAREASKGYEAGTLKKSNKAKVNDVVAHLAADPGAQKAMNKDYIYELTMAVARTGIDDGQLAKMGEALKNALPAEKAMARVRIIGERQFAGEALTAVLDALK